MGDMSKLYFPFLLLDNAEFNPVSTIGLYNIRPLTTLFFTFQKVVESAKSPPAEPPPTNILSLLILYLSALE